MDIQHARLTALRPSPPVVALAASDGQLLWDFLQARARIQPNTACGPDGVPPEVYLDLPFITVLHVFELFKKRNALLDGEASSSFWKMLEFVGLPKSKEVSEFGDLRWICKSAILQKWYMRASLPCLRNALRPSRVHAYGFKRQSNTSMVCGLIRQLLFLADSWGLPLLVACQDVSTAFDAMGHELISNALSSRGCPDHLTCRFVWELTGIHAVITLPGAGTTEPFEFNRGGKQGGVETPDAWNAIMDHLLEPLVISWEARGMGFNWDHPQVISHAVWADNIILFASSAAMMKQMQLELSSAITAGQLRWKPSSLEVLQAGSLLKESIDTFSVEQHGESFVYKRVLQLSLLGDLFDDLAATELSRSNRQGIADAIYYKHKHLLQHPGPVQPRLKAWHDSPATSAVFGAASWHLTSAVLAALRSWELGKLRQLFRMRRQPGEFADGYNKRTAHKIYSWFHKNSIKMAFHRALKMVYKSAWQESTSPCHFHATPLKWAREYRDEAWQVALSALPKRRRLLEGVKHQRRGPPKASWERPFVVAFGLHWRSRLTACSNQAEWMKDCETFINTVCDKWQLPRLGCDAPAEVVPRPLSVHIPVSRNEPPNLPTNPLDGSWDSKHGRLWVHVDCRSLAELFAGRAVLESDGHRPLMIRIAAALDKVHRRWLPIQNLADYIIWAPREYNTVADHAANATMDLKASWSIVNDVLLEQALADNANLRLCVDGGRRNQHLASIGMALYAARCDHDGIFYYELLVRQGHLLSEVESAFVAEALGLEWALEYLLKQQQHRQGQ